MNMKKLAMLIAVVMIMSVFVACGNKPNNDAKNQGAAPSAAPSANTAEATGKLADIKKAGKIVLGTSADYAPYEFHKSINGKDEVIGFDIEIAKEVAKELGVKLEIKDMDFDGLLPALQAGKVDFIISGMTPTEERAKAVDFSKVYYTAVQQVVVRVEDKDKFKTIESLKGKKIGAQKGSIQEKLVAEQLPNSEAKILAKIPDLFLELKNKKTDALVAEGPIATSYISKNKDLVVSDIKLTQDEAGSAIAFQKNNPALVEATNKVLDRLINDKSIDKFVTEANEQVE